MRNLSIIISFILLGLVDISYAGLKDTGFWKDVPANLFETNHYEVFSLPPATETIRCQEISALQTGWIQITAVGATTQESGQLEVKNDQIILNNITPLVDTSGPGDHHPYIVLAFQSSKNLQGIDMAPGYELIHCDIYQSSSVENNLNKNK